MSAVLLHPNCKINIGLRVLRKRADGYHDLETLFYPVYGLCDELAVETSEDAGQQIHFQAEGIAIDCAEEDNLIVRCYRRMAAAYPAIGSVEVRFRKHIPYGAGLGGGSSDAAHMALALNELFGLGLSREELCAQVAPLGADCAFFIYNTPCFAEGVGDLLRPVAMDLGGLRLVMIKPDVAVSTREAYGGIVPKEEPLAYRPSEGREWLQRLHNDFEDTVFRVHPELGVIKQRLLDAGAVYAAMSGSGSTVYGLFECDAESGSDTGLRALERDFAPMIIFDDTLGHT